MRSRGRRFGEVTLWGEGVEEGGAGGDTNGIKNGRARTLKHLEKSQAKGKTDGRNT